MTGAVDMPAGDELVESPGNNEEVKQIGDSEGPFHKCVFKIKFFLL